MNGNKIIHVHFDADGSDQYFGSIAAIYQEHTPDQIGAKYQTLANFRIGPDHPYKNGTVTIKEGTIIRKITNRKNPLK